MTANRSRTAELGALLRNGTLTARELAETTLDAIDRLQPELLCFAAVDPHLVLADADAADRSFRAGHDLGPLHGIPVGIKDIVDVGGYPTRCGSPLYPDTPVDDDAAIVAALKRSGAVIAGKTTSHELACGVTTPPTRNPRDPGRIPGGSSGGSGAAVAAGIVPIAVGSDTGGSIRIPASLCGVAGFKPTYGLLPLDGVEPLSPSLDTVGPIGGTIGDCAAAMEALVARPPADTEGRTSYSIGVLRDGPFTPVESGVARTLDRCEQLLIAAGHRCRTISIPELDHTLAIEFGLIPHEAFDHHHRSMRTDPGSIDPAIRSLITAGAVMDRSVHRRAATARRRYARAVASSMRTAGVDALMSPTLPGVAPRIGQTEMTLGALDEDIAVAFVRTTAPFNLTGQPVASIPAGAVDGLPVGIQIATAPGTDFSTLDIAARLESLLEAENEGVYQFPIPWSGPHRAVTETEETDRS